MAAEQYIFQVRRADGTTYNAYSAAHDYATAAANAGIRPGETIISDLNGHQPGYTATETPTVAPATTLAPASPVVPRTSTASNTPSNTTAPAIDYTLHNGETVAAYNARIASSRGYATPSTIDIIKDPVTGNQYSRDTSVATDTYKPYTGGPITPSSITPKTGLGISAPVSNSSLGAGIAASADSTVASIADRTAAQIQADQLTKQISYDLTQSAGQTSALNAERNKPGGVNELNSILVAKNNEITNLVAQRNALNASTKGKPMTMNSIIGEVAQTNAVLDAEIGSRTAEAQAIMGNITLAERTAQQAVDARYGPILEDLKIKQDQLELLQPILKAEEKVRADALDRQYKEQQNNLAIKIANEKDQNATILNLLQQYPGAGITLNDTVETAAYKASKTPQYQKTAKVPGKSTPGAPKKDLVGNMTSTLESHKGDDGYIEPAFYNKMRSAFKAEGGTLKEFDQQFAKYKNPNDTY